ncbi:DUF3015 family protein [Halobacteriovorax sp. JY17]|uniref:DUF3015 family protein n=1 Tax=Halobacteriovorax sp. JY17 TaxID=2014617 RepID=UPI000C607206|nr:DUF3015 family protein [Halobacteriovorax sp. JY17]PIK14766.1 MAG: hypothetical protein CES88_10535 [Halobacteriovorax sp. JY17]
MKKLILGLVAGGLISVSASAASYQAQGCGLGSTLFTDGSSLMHQVLGATTNGSSGNATFGMTSGTSNCELDGMGGQANAVFIKANKVALSNDIARGQGATLASLSRMYGCTNLKAVGSALQKNYKTIFSADNTEASSIDMSIRNVIETNKACI